MPMKRLHARPSKRAVSILFNDVFSKTTRLAALPWPPSLSENRNTKTRRNKFPHFLNFHIENRFRCD